MDRGAKVATTAYRSMLGVVGAPFLGRSDRGGVGLPAWIVATLKHRASVYSQQYTVNMVLARSTAGFSFTSGSGHETSTIRSFASPWYAIPAKRPATFTLRERRGTSSPDFFLSRHELRPSNLLSFKRNTKRMKRQSVCLSLTIRLPSGHIRSPVLGGGDRLVGEPLRHRALGYENCLIWTSPEHEPPDGVNSVRRAFTSLLLLTLSLL